MNPLTRYYVSQAGGGGSGSDGIGPILSLPHYVQRGHGIGNILGGLFRTLRPLLFSGIRTAGKQAAKTLGREALRTGGRILTDIADNPDTSYKDIISRQVHNTFQNLSTKMTGKGRKRKRRPASRASKKARRTTGKKKKPKRKRVARRTSRAPIKRDIFS